MATEPTRAPAIHSLPPAGRSASSLAKTGPRGSHPAPHPAREAEPLSLLLDHPWRVAAVEHQRVPVEIIKERHMTNAGVEHLALERHAALLERPPSRLDIVHVQGDRVAVDMMRGSRPVGVRHRYAAA
jgi:hypothetical protein